MRTASSTHDLLVTDVSPPSDRPKKHYAPLPYRASDEPVSHSRDKTAVMPHPSVLPHGTRAMLRGPDG
jgi:hypothetical protein